MDKFMAGLKKTMKYTVEFQRKLYKLYLAGLLVKFGQKKYNLIKRAKDKRNKEKKEG